MITEIESILRDAQNEIRGLRQRNQILEAQMSVVAVFERCVGIVDQPRGMSVDVVWQIQQYLDRPQQATES